MPVFGMTTTRAELVRRFGPFTTLFASSAPRGGEGLGHSLGKGGEEEFWDKGGRGEVDEGEEKSDQMRTKLDRSLGAIAGGAKPCGVHRNSVLVGRQDDE